MASNFLPLLTLILTFLPFILTIPTTSSTLYSTYNPTYPMTEMNFNGTIHGIEVEMSGTAESIYAQFSSSYPEIVESYKNGTLDARDLEVGSNLEKRNKVVPPLCVPVAGQDWYSAPVARIEEGIAYLQKLGGGCTVGARSCSRISCSWKSGIELCNDNYYDIAPSCIYLSSYAQDILNSCSYYQSNQWHAGGQEFDTDNYNIIVRYDGNNC